MTLEELRAAHAAKLTAARGLRAKLTDTTPTAEVRQIERDFDLTLAEADELRHQIEDARTYDTRPDPRRPRGADVAVPGGIPEGESEHRAAFASWLRDPNATSTRNRLAEVERRTHSGTVTTAGGFLVPTSIAGEIIRRARDENPLAPLVRRFTVSQSRFEIPVADANATVAWAAELDTRNATTETTFASKSPNMGTCYALVSFSEEILEDSAFDLADFYADEAGRMIGEAEMAAIISGAGGAAPVGLLNTAAEPDADGSRTADALRYIPSGSASSLGTSPADLLIRTVYDLHASYRRNAVWAMNSATASALRLLKDGTGRYLWADSLAEGQPNLLLGYPVVMVESLADIGTDALPILFGDFRRGYAMTELSDNRGITALADPYTTPGRVRIYLRRRVGGCPLDENSIRAIKCATT